MPRANRPLVDHGIYHVYNRGNNKENLFKKQRDFEKFYSLLLKGKESLQANFFHYCFMNNHFHLLIHIKRAHDLPMLMHKTQRTYAIYYKKNYGLNGHLFQSRYKSSLIEQESYYLHCGRYIERNPIKAYLVSNPVDYPWSSSAFYGLGKKDQLVTENIYYRELGTTPVERQKEYQEFLATHDPYESNIDRLFR